MHDRPVLGHDLRLSPRTAMSCTRDEVVSSDEPVVIGGDQYAVAVADPACGARKSARSRQTGVTRHRRPDMRYPTSKSCPTGSALLPNDHARQPDWPEATAGAAALGY